MTLKKRIFAIALTVCMLMVLSVSAFAGAADSTYYSCNMYAAKSTGSGVVRYLPAGSPCTIDERSGDWTAIITVDSFGNHVDGWVKTANLTNTGHDYRTYTPTYNTYYAPQAVPSGNAHTVLTATMHETASEYAANVGTIPINTPVTVVSNVGNGWVQVCYNGVYGYISQAAVSYYSAPASANYGMG